MMSALRAIHPPLLSAILLWGAAGCGKKEPVPTPATPPLARVGDSVIMEKDFADEAKRRADAGRPAADKASLLQELIERQVMLQKAKADPVTKDPELQRELENQMLTHWLDGSLQQARNQVAVSDDELRKAYDADPAAHTRPAMVRVAMLYRKVAPSDPADERQRIRAGLLAARDAYRRDPAAATQNGRISGFGAVAADTSEDAVSRYRGGDIGWLQPGLDQYRWPKAVVQAAFALKKGETSDLLEVDDGLYVVMKSDERSSVVTPFEEAKITMRRGMIRAKQAAVEAQFRSNLLSGVKIEINQASLARLELPHRASSATPVTPGMDAEPAPPNR